MSSARIGLTIALYVTEFTSAPASRLSRCRRSGMLTDMTGSVVSRSQRRGWLMMLLIVACARVFAGAPDIEAHDHVLKARSVVNFGLALEHTHVVSHESDPSQAHFHCHSACAHAAIVAPSYLPPEPVIASALTPFDIVPRTSSPVFAHFRPPQA